MKGLKSVLFVLLIGVIALVFLYAFLQNPSNSRNWEVGFELTPEVTISDSSVTIKNIRNWDYSKDEIISQEFIDQTYNTGDLEKVWFLVEPFSKWDAIAHTYFVFDFKNQEPISFSIEARREKGESYSSLQGAFNKYELMYMWGTEKDFTGRRIYKDDADVFMYPLNITKESGQKLFLELARSTEDLRNNPKFYNTLTSNCTSKLADHANNIKAGSIPFHYARLLPGYSDELLYKLDYIPNNKPLDEIKKSYYITDIVKDIYNEENFSQVLRMRIQED